MPEPTALDLSAVDPKTFDTDSLTFIGPRGDRRRHLDMVELTQALAALPPAPRERGRLELIVARGARGERELPESAMLSVEQGLPGDRWHDNGKYGPEYQLAVTRFDFARVIANGQPLELHGDNLYLSLDLSADNLPPGSLLELGEALLSVTPQAHNGCKKWAQRFGIACLKLNLDPKYRREHVRGIYLRVTQAGRVRVGDEVSVMRRGP